MNGTVTFLKPQAAKVELISCTYSQSQTIGKLCRTFDGELSNKPVPEADVARHLEQMQKTALQGPLEMVSYIFLLQDVTRAFQQQITRYRIGTAFVIESLRFTEKREARILNTAKDSPHSFELAAKMALEVYWGMLDSGEAAEDARGVLPLNLCSDMFVSVTLRTLMNMYAQRICIQSQHGEWQPVLHQMRDLIPEEAVRTLPKMSCDNGGGCIFASDWDRPCPKRAKV